MRTKISRRSFDRIFLLLKSLSFV